MFASKEDVDDHAKRLLRLYKNDDYNCIQCQTISKLYYDIKEFAMAKIYIERYLKLQSNSETGLVLKANIHNELKEYNYVLQCYKRLYNISERNDYIIKICDCLMKISIDLKEAKSWIDWLELQTPYCEQLIKLKIRFCSDFDSFSKDLVWLEKKMKHDNHNQYKHQYLLILEKAPISDNVLAKCIDILEKCDVLDDIGIGQCCVNIFKKNMFSTSPFPTQIYCILLISVIKNSYKRSLNNCAEYLSELQDSLRVIGNDDLGMELKSQFLFHLIDFAHSSTIYNKNMTDEFSYCFSKLYGFLHNTRKDISDDRLPKQLCNWLNRQSCYRCSIVNHMTYNVNENIKMHILIDILGNIIWPSKISDYSDLQRIFEEQPTRVRVNDYVVLTFDILCHTPEYLNFHFILWQLLCHLNWFRNKDSSDLTISSSAITFIASLLESLFPKLVENMSFGRGLDNISNVDIITFLLGAALTYRKSVVNAIGPLPVPFVCFKKMFVVDNDLRPWWCIACDYLMNNKSNTCIGVGLEVLRKGLKIVQMVDSDIPESIKLPLGHCLAKYADNCNMEKETVLKRSFSFLYSVIQSYKPKHSPITFQKMSHSDQLPFSKKRSSKSTFELELFDTITVSDDVIEAWRFDAILFCIDVKLKSLDDFHEIEDLISWAEKINPNHPYLCLLISRLYLNFATKTYQHDFENEGYTYFATLALRFANKCGENIILSDNLQHFKLELLLKEQLAALDDADMTEYFLMHDVVTEVNSYHNKERIFQKMNYCIKKCDNATINSIQSQYDIFLLKSKIASQTVRYFDMVIRFKKLTTQLENLIPIENDYFRLKNEQKLLINQLQDLVDIVKDLEWKNSLLESKILRFEDSSSTMNLINLDKGIRTELIKVENIVRDHFNGFDEIALSTFNENVSSQNNESKTKQSEPLQTGLIKCDSQSGTLDNNINNRKLSSRSSSSSSYNNGDNVSVKQVSETNSKSEDTEDSRVTEEQKHDSDDESTSEESIRSLYSDTKRNIDIPEDTDPRRTSSSELPYDEMSMVEDGWTVVYNTCCKLFSYWDKNWTESGSGNMKILSRQENDDFSARLLMTRVPENTVCYDRSVSTEWPVFRSMDSSSFTVCWLDNTSRNSSVPYHESFALRFKTESALKEFTTHVCSLKGRIEDEDDY